MCLNGSIVYIISRLALVGVSARIVSFVIHLHELHFSGWYDYCTGKTITRIVVVAT